MVDTESVPPPPPSSWCQETRDQFTPVRPLGVGGFGSVYLARRKTTKTSDDASATTDDILVAIKIVGHPHNQKVSSFEQISEAGYFKREVSILQEISHPRIMRCLQVIEDHATSNSSCAPYCMILEYCRGPTVEQLLKYGGAFGIYLAQEVSSQLIDVISYLHGRAVIHRDIKPDNIIVCGAKYLDEASWSDDIEGDDAAKSMRWSIKLIDFGFARPLRPDDIVDENIQKTKKEPRDEFFGRSTVNTQLDGKSVHKTGFGFDLSNSGKDLSTSISRFKITSLSAVGNRNFAAPEIKKGIRVFKRRGGAKKTKEEQEPLSECVSDYGMIVDAFSTGATIRYMCTGIPPQISVDEFMQEKNSALKVFGRKLKKAIKKDNDKRKKRYRSNNELPSEAVRLILGMTHWNEKKRTSVRSARTYEWIASSYTMKNAPHTQSEEHGAKLDFLECAMKTQEKQDS